MTSHPASNGPWKIEKRSRIYSDPWIQLQKDDVIRPDGDPGTYAVVHLKPGVCVLAWQGEQVFLTSEFHYGVGRVTLEAVSGGIESDEDPLVCAKRELSEELGITASTWIPLSTVDPFTASVVSPTQLYLATDLTFGTAQPEGTELIDCVSMAIPEAIAAVDRGEITHAPSVITILQLARRVGA